MPAIGDLVEVTEVTVGHIQAINKAGWLLIGNTWHSPAYGIRVIQKQVFDSSEG